MLLWRRVNVWYIFNEFYVDVVEMLLVMFVLLGRLLVVFVNGMIVFMIKVLGVLDIVVMLSGLLGKYNLKGIVDLFVFYLCVRLVKWRE